MTKARILADYVAGGTTAAEFDYMDGVTSNVQTQLDAKLPLAGGTMTGDLVPATPMSHRSIVINGAMKIAQRGTQEHPVDTTNYSACDRFQVHNRTAGTCDTYSDSESPDDKGFSNSLKVDITALSSGTTPSDNEAVIGTYFEGQDLQQIRKGTSEALPLTLSFWVRSPKTGIHIVELYDFDSSTQRFVSAPYTISTANTWQFVTHTFPADTASGKEFDNDNAKSLGIQWWLCAASDFTSGTLDQTWRDEASNANRAVGQVNVFENQHDNFYLTGVQLELGSSATPFEHRSYGDELIKCMRYYQKYRNESSGNADMVTGWAQSTSAARLIQPFPVWMRVGPSLTYPQAATTMYLSDGISASNQCSALTAHAYMSDQIMDLAFTANNSDLTAFRHYYLFLGADNEAYYLGFDAEL